MSILFFWLERGGGWGFESINQPGWSSQFECNPKMSILFFLAGEGWWTGFKSINQPGRSSQFERNPKMGILFFWLATGGRWGSSPSTSPADHEKLNVMQKQAFYFFGWRGVADEGLSPSISLAHHQKLNVIKKWAFYFFGQRWVADKVWVHRPAWLINKVEHNPKMSILIFWLERGGRWGSSPSTSLANHQKLNIIQKWAFHFFGWRWVVDGVWAHQPAWPIIRSWT